MPLSLGVKLKLGAPPERYGEPFFVTDQEYEKVSMMPGSLIVLVRLTVLPSEMVLGAPLICTTGATLATIIEIEVKFATPPSSSATDKSTSYRPSSSGVKVKFAVVSKNGA